MLMAFDSLAPNQVAEFINDHEPKALRATDEDREIVLYDVPPYGGFNEAAVFDEGTAEVTVIARGDVDVLEIPAQFMRQLITRSPEIATGVARFFAQRQRRLTSAAGNLAFGRVLTRIVLWWSLFTALTGCIWYFSYDIGQRLWGESYVFFLGDRFFGTVTAYVPGPDAARFSFTSGLAVQLLKVLEPELRPLINSSPIENAKPVIAAEPS